MPNALTVFEERAAYKPGLSRMRLPDLEQPATRDRGRIVPNSGKAFPLRPASLARGPDL
jgi:hypothetical protein